MKSTYRHFAVLFVTICLSLLVIPVKLAVAEGQSKRISVEYEAGHAMFDLHDLLSELPVEVRKDELVEMRN
jgi:hypothetical protein